MATITVQEISQAGLEATYAAANDGDVFTNTGQEMLQAINASGGDIIATITPAKPVKNIPGLGDMTKSTVTVTITAGEERFIGPFEPAVFNNSSGQVTINYDGVTSLTSAVLKLPRVA